MKFKIVSRYIILLIACFFANIGSVQPSSNKDTKEDTCTILQKMFRQADSNFKGIEGDTSIFSSDSLTYGLPVVGYKSKLTLPGSLECSIYDNYTIGNVYISMLMMKSNNMKKLDIAYQKIINDLRNCSFLDKPIITQNAYVLKNFEKYKFMEKLPNGNLSGNYIDHDLESNGSLGYLIGLHVHNKN